MSSHPPLLTPAGAPPHAWNFFRTGGLDQVALTTAADLRALGQLDPKLWVALSCPVKGLELDEKTLALIDADGDGRIRAPELIAAVQWTAERLKDPASLLRGADSLPLAAINDATPEGRVILAAAQQILAGLGQAGATDLPAAATADLSKIFTASALNGDGVIPVEATADPAVQALIRDILACRGGITDRTGETGVTAAKADEFFQELAAYVAWVEEGAGRELAELGAATGAACAALRAVRAKVDDYFARGRLAAFDPRALAALNRPESDYLAIAAQELPPTAAAVAGFPLARIEAGRPLPLLEGVNPAWAGALATLQAAVVAPLLGAGQTTLTEAQWHGLTARFAAYEAWLGRPAGASVALLGLARARELLAGHGRAALADLLAQDLALAPEFRALSAVDRLVRYHRDLRALLCNFVNFADFYSRDHRAIFQAGTLFVDSRSCELCLRVDDPAAHAALASSSKAYIAYVDCRRASGETMKIAACVTQGDSDFLVTGRNGLFYDRQGRDWDATITKIIDNPISLRQAFWSPYKKFVRMLEEQVAKRAAAADAEASSRLASTAETAANADRTKPAPKKIDSAPWPPSGLPSAPSAAPSPPSPPGWPSSPRGSCPWCSWRPCCSSRCPPWSSPGSSCASGPSDPSLMPTAGPSMAGSGSTCRSAPPSPSAPPCPPAPAGHSRIPTRRKRAGAARCWSRSSACSPCSASPGSSAAGPSPPPRGRRPRPRPARR